MRVLCVFIDGIGIGRDDPRVNPFAAIPSQIFPASLDVLQSVAFDGRMIPTDACLGVPGLPQSATGQTAIFSGINASQHFGKHRSGFATPAITEILRRESLFVKAIQREKTAAFANAYGREFFDLPAKVRARVTSVTTAATQTAGLRFLLAEDILRGRSLYHDFTNVALKKRGYDYPEFTPEFAGKQLAALSQAYDLCLYEYFLSDRIGHFGDLALAIAEAKKLDAFMMAVLEHTDLRSTVVVLCSDHGNMEDMSVITHTLNPVPTVVWGDVSQEMLSPIHSLTDVTPFIMRCLDI